MEIALTVIFALLGMAIGSFLNVCIDRIPAGKSLVSPPSHCDSCQHPLAPQDLIPVFSYLWLRGCCRYCHARIPMRPLWVEVGTAFLLAFSYWHYGLSADFAVTAFYSCIFVVIMVIDWEHQLILNKITYPAAVVALIISIFHPPPGIIDIPLPWQAVATGISGIVTSLLGGAVGFVFLLIPALINPRGMGWGDVKMAALIGLVTGFPLILVSMVMGVVLGGLVAIVLLVLKIKKRKEAIPFGPFLSVATIATLLWGSDILRWYLGFF